jgi:hypothetical protein
VTISLGLLVLISVLLMWKLKGIQWPALILGMMLHATAPAEGVVDRTTDQIVQVFESIVDSGTSTAEQVF